MILNKIERKPLTYTVFFSIFFSGLIIISIIAVSISLDASKRGIISKFSQYAVYQLDIQKRLMVAHSSTIQTDIHFLTKLNELQRYKEEKNEEDRKAIEKEFLEFIKSTDNYDQLRFIDETGMEVIRVDYNNGNPKTVPQDKLQNKDSRYYFKETIKIPKGYIYVSPFDLNIEHNKIEQPLKPMIRFGTPIYSSEGSLKGIIILNFFGSKILQHLAVGDSKNPGKFSLLNAGGYWLFNNNPDEEWGFMYPDKKDLTLSKKNPELWSSIRFSENFQQLHDDAIYTSSTVDICPGIHVKVCPENLYLMNTINLEEIGISQEQQRSKFNRLILISAVICATISILLTIFVIQRYEYRERLKTMALYDHLTGLPNRQLIEARGLMTLELSKRNKNMYVVMFIDLDGFKEVNDTLGHKAGDQLLKEAGHILERSIRSSDTASRFGGDEFIVLLSQINSEHDSGAVARKILDGLSKDFTISGKFVSISASIGVAAVRPTANASFNEVLMAADAAMYDVKNSGKNNYKIVTL